MAVVGVKGSMRLVWSKPAKSNSSMTWTNENKMNGMLLEHICGMRFKSEGGSGTEMRVGVWRQTTFLMKWTNERIICGILLVQ